MPQSSGPCQVPTFDQPAESASQPRLLPDPIGCTYHDLMHDAVHTMKLMTYVVNPRSVPICINHQCQVVMCGRGKHALKEMEKLTHLRMYCCADTARSLQVLGCKEVCTSATSHWQSEQDRSMCIGEHVSYIWMMLSRSTHFLKHIFVL